MFVKFVKNWKWAEQGIFVRPFICGQQYARSDKCSDTEILPEAADLAVQLGVAEEVQPVKQQSVGHINIEDERITVSPVQPKPEEKKSSSGRSKLSLKKKR